MGPAEKISHAQMTTDGTPADPPDPEPSARRDGGVAYYALGGRRRRWTWRVAWVVWMAIGVIVAAVFGIEQEAQRLLDQVSPNIPQVAEARAVLNPASGGATTFLILGSSRRPYQAPWLGNSDTMILVRMDPQQNLISMMSIPRDLQVQMPGYSGVQKIDWALSEGGPKLSIRVVRQVLGVPINHYVLVFWQGFFDIVQQVGGVYTQVDRRYYNPVGDSWTPIDLHPGYQLLNGNQALQYVRFRHLDTDIVRESRQQKFLLDLRQQATASLSIADTPALLGAVSGSLQTDVHDVTTVINLARFVLGLPKGRIYRTTLDVTLGPSFVYASQTQIQASVQRYLHPVLQPTGTTRLASAAPRADVHVTVENGGAGPLAAFVAANALRAHGFDAVTGGSAPSPQSQTTLYYAPAATAAAQTLASALKPVLLAPAPAGMLSGGSMVLDLGPDFDVANPFAVKTAPTGAAHSVVPTAPGLVTDATTDRAITATVRHPGFPLLVPTQFAENSTLAPVEGVRAYRIQARGAGSWPAVNLSFQLGAPGYGQYWDVMETTMPSPPLFAQAADSVSVGGQVYEIVNDGSGVRDVAFRRRGTWYWVNNTINDALSSAQMMGIAQHLR